MPLINFPDVPNIPGVPNVSRLASGIVGRSLVGLAARTGILQKIQGLDKFGLLGGLVGDIGWAVLDKNGAFVIQPDSVLSFEYRGEEKVATHPVEKGSFGVHNKVAMPFDIRLRMTCNGQGLMDRAGFLDRLDKMKSSTDLYSISTPEKVYQGMNMEHYDLRRDSKGGVKLLTVDAWFIEVRETPSKTPKTAQPQGGKKISIGTVSFTLPTPAQLGAFITRKIF